MKDVKVCGFREMNHYSNHEIINTTSRSKNWSKGLSPFFVGPVKMYKPFICENVENGWQYSKLYSEHADEYGNPTDAYWKWAKKGWKGNYADRYPMGKGRKPLCSVWFNQKLNYIEARKRIYVPLYAKGVIRTKAYKRLKHMYESDVPFVLLDFDGYDYLKEGKSLNDVLHDPKKKMGHAFVLAMLLQDQIDLKNKTYRYMEA